MTLEEEEEEEEEEAAGNKNTPSSLFRSSSWGGRSPRRTSTYCRRHPTTLRTKIHPRHPECARDDGDFPLVNCTSSKNDFPHLWRLSCITYSDL